MTTTRTTTAPRTFARFFATEKPLDNGLYAIADRTEGNSIIAEVKGRAAARNHASILNAINPDVRTEDEPVAEAPAEAKPAANRTSHAACDHASSKLARAICRRDRRSATIAGDQVEASTPNA